MKSYAAIILLMFELVNAQTWYSFQGYDYMISSVQLVNSYAEAEAACAAKSATVANVKTTEIQNFLVSKIGTLPGKPYLLYIGATKNQATNQFQWTDGTSVDVTQWNAGEPNNLYGNENCLSMGREGEVASPLKWFDVPCSTNARYICERKQAATTTTATTATTATTTTTTTATTTTTPATTTSTTTTAQSTLSTYKPTTDSPSTLLSSISGLTTKNQIQASKTDDNRNFPNSTAFKNMSTTSQGFEVFNGQCNLALLISAVTVVVFLLTMNVIGLVVIVKLKKKVSRFQNKEIFDWRQNEKSNHENSNPSQYYMNENEQKAPAAVSFATYVNIIDNQRSVKNQRIEDEYIEFNE